ncbi:MAG: class I SAM-dependent methyltransferase [Myxococcota bacterium]|nr:class I SAM-dependent methyltransferase [Myxococcota bacterium]
MSLLNAEFAADSQVELPGQPPYACKLLEQVAGQAFSMPPTDDRLTLLHQGESVGSPPLDNLVGMIRAWQDHPEWLDFLDPNAPNFTDKRLERDLYLHHWAPWIPRAGRILDVGGGVGRFTTWFLDHGLSVELADPDLRSLWRALQHAAGRRGFLDLHWSTAECLPQLPPVDAAIAAEVLCYVENPRLALQQIAKNLAPGAPLLLSVEARWGWAQALDAAPGTLPALLKDGIVHVPGDRWIRTYTRSELLSLLEGWEILMLRPSHYACSGPYEAAAGQLDLDELLVVEEALRQREQTQHNHRAWMAVARRPVDG